LIATPLLTEIRRDWRNVRGRALHAAGCSCCGGQAILLDAGALAESIQHALRVAYQARPELLQLLDTYLDPDGRDFIGGLSALADDTRQPEVETILRNVREVLRSVRGIGFSATSA
jgi:hypothetical protein